MNVREVQHALKALGIHPSRMRGQHFLVDPRVLATIVDAGSITHDDLVLEIGPGLGVLTRELVVRAGRVVAVEVDQALAQALEKQMGSEKLQIVYGDVLRQSTHELFGSDEKKYKLIANIPYNITSAILERFLINEPAPSLIVLLVQREVAERMVAVPPNVSRLSLMVQYFGIPEIIRQVPASAFSPPPNVSSSVVRIIRHEASVLKKRPSWDHFSKLTAAGFSAPRRKLLGNIVRGLGCAEKELREHFRDMGISEDARPSTVSFEAWLMLAKKTSD